MLFRSKGILYVSLYVDDGLCSASSEQVYNDFINEMREVFTISAHGPLKTYLGTTIVHDRVAGKTTMSQRKYLEDLLTKYKMQGCKPADTPMQPGKYLTADDCGDKHDKEYMKTTVKEYQSLVGALLWLSTNTRPDISFAVNQLARFLSAPGPSHVSAAHRVLRYLAGSRNIGISYIRTNDTTKANVLTAYTDASFADDPEDRRSVTGFMF